MKNFYFSLITLLSFFIILVSNDAKSQSCTAFTSQQNVTCNGGCNGSGTVTFFFGGGTGTPTYSWNTTPVQTTATATNLCAGTYVVTVTGSNGCQDQASITITQPTPISATTSQVNVLCYGGSTGSATITVSGGGTYTYAWNTNPVQTTQTATGLTAGTYTVVATRTSSGCTVSRTVTITQGPQITGSISTTPSDCGQSNGTATASASGGTGAFTYSWNTNPVQTTATATGLAAGDYIVTVTDANGCTQSGPATVENIGGPELSVSATNINCSGGDNGTATVTATGGTEPYTYSWNTDPVQTTQTAVGLTAGTYTATVTDGQGCYETIDVTIIDQNSMIVTTTQINISCNGGASGSATATASGGTGPYYYLWNTVPSQNGPTASGLTYGTYTVTAVDANSCSATATVTITQADVFVTTTDHTNISCNGENDGTASVNVFGGNPPYQFSWNSNPIQTTQTAVNLSAGNFTVTVTDVSGCVTTAGVTITQPAAITLSASATTTSCGQTAGTVTATASGGTGVLSYSWDTNPVQTTATATGLSAGTYTVTVTDEGNCSATASATVTSPGGPSSTATHTNVSCNGGNNGTATVNATGGSQPYSYSWSGGQTTQTAFGLSAGTYTVTVTDQANCTTLSTVTITQPLPLTISIESENVQCNGLSSGSATATVTGGVSSYSYSWDTQPEQTTAAITGLDAGTYTISVIDNNGCEASASVTINEPAELTANTIQTHVSCYGGSNGAATVNPIGGTQPYSYSWNTNPVQTTQTAINLTSGNYSVLVTDDNGCNITKQVTITEPSFLNTNYTTTPEDCGQSNGSIAVTATGGTGNYTYSWNTNPVQTTATATGLASGTYTLTVTDANGCIATLTVNLPNAGGLFAEATSTNVSCFGGTNGTATLHASGGAQPYVYAWNTNPVQSTESVTDLAAGTYTGTVTDDNGCIFTVTATITEPEALTVSAEFENILCFGQATGTATANVAGGTTPYLYAWDTEPVQTTSVISALTAGTYTVEVTDENGCVASATVNITQPGSALTASVIKTNVSCNGGNNGAATANPTGGTGPYTYNWNTVPAQSAQTAFGLSAGSYTVVVTDANGCSISKNTTITQPAAVETSLSVVPAACGQSTGSATVTASGGAGNFTYSWNTSPEQTAATASSLEAGIYTVTVTDGNGCVSTETATLNNENAPLLDATATNASCFSADNGIATVAASGGSSPYTYSWNTNPAQTTSTVTGLAPGSYLVSVTDDGGCTSFATITITEPTEITTSTNSTDPTCDVCADGSATVNASGGTPGYTYLWSNGQTTATALDLAEGTYCVTITDDNGCETNTCVTLTALVTGVVNASLSDNSFTVYPNPTSGFVTVELETSQLSTITLTLTNMLGQNIVSQQSEVNGLFKQVYDLSAFAEGLYFITVRSEKETLLRKVIKK